MYEDNKWYGHRYILLRYLNVKNDRNIFAQIQHGWYGTKSDSFNTKNKSILNRMVLTLAWYRHYNKNNNANIISIGSPFLYLDNLSNKKKIKANGILFIPSHSRPDSEFIKAYIKKGWTTIDDEGNKFVYKRNLSLSYYVKQIEKKYNPPYSVCLHPADYENKNITSFFKKKNWHIIVAVGRDDNQSLFKLRLLLLRHKNIIFSDFTSTALLYAMYLKKKVKVISYHKDRDNEIVNFEKKNKYIFKNYQNIKIAYKIAYKELGCKFKKNKNDLKKILDLNNPIKNILAKLIGIFRDFKYKPK